MDTEDHHVPIIRELLKVGEVYKRAFAYPYLPVDDGKPPLLEEEVNGGGGQLTLKPPSL